MKNTLKKLLCMAMAIMLLVSAVPVFAAAEGEGGDAPITVPVNVYVGSKCYPKSIIVAPDSEITLTEDYAMNGSGLVTMSGHTFNGWTNPAGEPATGNALPYSWVKEQGDGYFLNLYLDQDGSEPSSEPTEPSSEPTEPSSEPTEPSSEPTEPSSNPTVPDDPDEPEDPDDPEDTRVVTFNANGGVFPNGKTNIKVTIGYREDLTFEEIAEPTRAGYLFSGWALGANDKTGVDGVYDVKNDTKVYAIWTTINDVVVTAKVYKNGFYSHSRELITLTAFNGDSLLQFLNENADLIESRIPSGYTWGPTSSDGDNYFYTYNNESKLTAQNEKTYAKRNVCIRIYSTEQITAGKVLLYVHSKVGGTATVYDMKDFGFGYVVGDQVTRSHVKTVLDRKYTYSSFDGLYDDTAWKQLCAGKSPTDASSVTVPDADGVSVHVVLKNSATKSSGVADKSNPKTGDTIFAPMAIMGLTATALAAAYVIGKKRFAR